MLGFSLKKKESCWAEKGNRDGNVRWMMSISFSGGADNQVGRPEGNIGPLNIGPADFSLFYAPKK